MIMKAFNVILSLPRYAAPLAVLLLVFGLFALPAQAQRRGMSEEERAERFENMMRELTEAVDLNAVQADTVRQILSEEREAMRERRGDRAQNRGNARRGIRQQRAEIQDTYMARIEEVLTDEQVERYRAFMKEQREERGGRRGRRGGGS